MKWFYWIRRWGKSLFLMIAIVLAFIFIWYSYELTRDLSSQERERMAIWADATHELASPDNNPLSFPLSVIEGNRSIPVILTDSEGNLLLYRNIEDNDPARLEKQVEDLKAGGNRIVIEFSPGEMQYIYYEDSTLLKRLSRYPWVELSIIIAFLIVAYIGFNASKKMEQNRLWVGLSKETAHQLGTPISSLIGWLEFLRTTNTDPMIIEEMTRDVNRLSDVSARFSKIGSKPDLAEGSVDEAVTEAVAYMKKRITSRISLNCSIEPGDYRASLSAPLVQWVMENLIKNAVDATGGVGSIDIDLKSEARQIVVLIRDTGKGIPRNKWRRIFQPGFTTKKRGWGLGLALTKRIVEEYHGGSIEVSDSVLGKGTEFKIVFPKMNQQDV